MHLTHHSRRKIQKVARARSHATVGCVAEIAACAWQLPAQCHTLLSPPQDPTAITGKLGNLLEIHKVAGKISYTGNN